MKIHPTALIDSSARLDRDVEVGPFSVIGAQVKVGAQSVIGGHVVIEGSVVIGARNTIGHGAIIGTPPQDLAFRAETKSGVCIGDDNIIRELSTIHRATNEGGTTTLGDKNFLMAGAHVGHNCVIGNSVIIANNCLLGGHVQIFDGAFLGGGCVFHQFTRIGRLTITQGRSGFGMDIPPFTIAAERNHVVGLNVVGLRRAGWNPAERNEIKAAFKLIYLSGLNVGQALARAAEKNWSARAQEFFDFITAAKKRGICSFADSARGNGE